ncbi:extended synaptotagmin-2 isoform X1 [Tachysurus ichikawai]
MANGSDPKRTGAQDPNPKPQTPRTESESLSDLEPYSEPQTAVTDAKNTGLKFAKSFLLVFPVYVLGYLGFSFSWILISLVVLFWLRRNQGTRFSGVNKALAFLEHEEQEVKQTLPTSELPSWVSESFYISV